MIGRCASNKHDHSIFYKYCLAIMYPGMQIRVQHCGKISLFWLLFDIVGDDFKISCLGEFFAQSR